MAYYFRTPVEPAFAIMTALKNIEELPDLCGHVRCRAGGKYLVMPLSPEARAEKTRELEKLILAAQTKHLLAYDVSKIGADYWASCLDAALGMNQDDVESEATLAMDFLVGTAEENDTISGLQYYAVVGFDTPEGAAAFVKNFQDRDIIV